MSKNTHGGNIYKKAKELGIASSEILDFSANINPIGLPDHIRQAMIDAIDGIINYPDPDCEDLKSAIAVSDGVSRSAITCGNGGADLLYRIGFGLKPKKVLLPVPAFVEYEEALTAAGAGMDYYYMQEGFVIREDFLARIDEETDLLIICNPSNPTGILTERDFLLRVLDKARETGTLVMVDECFLEIVENEAAYTLKPFVKDYDNLIILKSFTKLYAIPGVRLGYIIAGNPDIIEKVNRAGQAWSVSHIAQAAGLAALKDTEYKKQVIETTARELAFMKEELGRLPIRLYDGAANYLFFRAPGISDLDRRLEKYGIMIRNCSNYVNLGDDYWRVAVKSREENQKIIGALHQVLG